MSPGDLIKWFYEISNRVVVEDEKLWSTLTKQWVPIGSSLVHVLVSINGEQITWMNEEGLFRAHVDDAMNLHVKVESFAVVPHACG